MLVAGGRAPVVVSEDMVRGMKKGAVIVDVAVAPLASYDGRPRGTLQAATTTRLRPLRLAS